MSKFIGYLGTAPWKQLLFAALLGLLVFGLSHVGRSQTPRPYRYYHITQYSGGAVVFDSGLLDGTPVDGSTYGGPSGTVAYVDPRTGNMIYVSGTYQIVQTKFVIRHPN